MNNLILDLAGGAIFIKGHICKIRNIFVANMRNNL